MKSSHRNLLHPVIILLLTIVFPWASSVADQSEVKTKVSIQVQMSEELETGAVNGRLLVFFGKGTGAPMQGPNWFGPEPFFGKDVTGVKPGDVITIDQELRGCPGTFDDIKSGRWKVQAVLDHDLESVSYTHLTLPTIYSV